MNKTITVYLQNGGTGTWLSLPADMDDFQRAMREINAATDEAISINEYKSNVTALPIDLLSNVELDLVNFLAAQLAGLEEKLLTMLNAIMESSFRFTTIEQFIDYEYNEDYFLFRPGINDTTQLGRYYVYDTGLCQMPEEWKGGIDLERFGAHVAKQERGEFTQNGYLMLSGDEWKNKLSECGIPNKYHLNKRD